MTDPISRPSRPAPGLCRAQGSASAEKMEMMAPLQIQGPTLVLGLHTECGKGTRQKDGPGWYLADCIVHMYRCTDEASTQYRTNWKHDDKAVLNADWACEPGMDELARVERCLVSCWGGKTVRVPWVLVLVLPGTTGRVH